MSSPTVVRTRADLAAVLAAEGRSDKSVCLVPTMGALHEGHGALLRHGREQAETLVASIFVNPTQFAPGEDYGTYPRTFEVDLRQCAQAGVDVVFAPAVATMYPGGSGEPTVALDPGPLGAVLEGAARPTHFAGVLTVVAKLFGLVRPDVAVFGEKDYQQLVLIRAMTRALCMPVSVLGCPTVREADGLAMSSRNRNLIGADRDRALALSGALRAGSAAAVHGPEAVLAAARTELGAYDEIDLDYLVLTDDDLGQVTPGRPARLLVAARVGGTRLLDNTAIDLGAGPWKDA